MNKFVKFFHELMNPHCTHCQHDKEDAEICFSCETLRGQLNVANSQNEKLLKTLLEINKPPVEVIRTNEAEEPKKLSGHVPWSVRKQLLEQDSIKRAQLLKQTKESIDKLEEEVGVSDSMGE